MAKAQKVSHRGRDRAAVHRDACRAHTSSRRRQRDPRAQRCGGPTGGSARDGRGERARTSLDLFDGLQEQSREALSWLAAAAEPRLAHSDARLQDWLLRQHVGLREDAGVLRIGVRDPAVGGLLSARLGSVVPGLLSPCLPDRDANGHCPRL